MGSVLAQLEPVVTPAVDWAGLLPVLLPAAGALVLLMVRSLVPSRLLPAGLDALWTFAVAAAWPCSLLRSSSARWRWPPPRCPGTASEWASTPLSSAC